MRNPISILMYLVFLLLGFGENTALAKYYFPKDSYVPGEVIVKIKGTQTKKTFLANYSFYKGQELIVSARDEHFALIRFKADDANIWSIIDQIEKEDSVIYAEPNYIYEASSLPEDSYFSQLWGLSHSGSQADIDAIAAWGEGSGSRQIKIAVIDTGIDYNHEDLKDNMWTNLAELNGQVGVDDDGNGYVDDIHGYDFANDDGDPMDGNQHGTHCAGTIGATHNEIGIAGVMKEVSLIGVKFLADNGSGTSANAIKAIDYATKQNVDIMNNSWGGGSYSEALKEAIIRAKDRGIVFVAAAGNNGTNNDLAPQYPANYDVENVISVAAHDSNNNLASFSCFGPSTVHISAPGVNILSTTPNNTYSSLSGTSMAAPHVSGTIGLLLASQGRFDHLDLRQRLMKSSKPHVSYRSKVIGRGHLSAYNLLTKSYPVRNEPDDQQWQDYNLNTPWESTHPYLDNTHENKSFHIPGAKFIRVVVSQYDLEQRYDYLEISNIKKQSIEKVWGKGSGLESQYVIGDTVNILFHTDRSINKWGFSIEKLQYQ